MATRPESPTQGPRPKGAARCRPVFTLRGWHQAVIRPHLFECALYLSSQLPFLHFTLNHFKQSWDWFLVKGIVGSSLNIGSRGKLGNRSGQDNRPYGPCEGLLSPLSPSATLNSISCNSVSKGYHPRLGVNPVGQNNHSFKPILPWLSRRDP